VKKIVHLRIRKRLGPVQLAGWLEMAPSTVHAALKRCRRITPKRTPTRQPDLKHAGWAVHLTR